LYSKILKFTVLGGGSTQNQKKVKVHLKSQIKDGIQFLIQINLSIWEKSVSKPIIFGIFPPIFSLFNTFMGIIKKYNILKISLRFLSPKA